MRYRILLATLAILAGAWTAQAQDVSVRYQGQVIGSRGLPLANQSVAVCTQPAVTSTQPCSPLATLATSTSTSSGGANPLPSDVNGNYFFYAAPGKYTVQIYGPQVSGQFVQPDTVLVFPSTLLNAQANAAAITGTGSAATVYTYTLPANLIVNLKCIRITFGLSHSTGSASVQYVLSLNGVSLVTVSNAASGSSAAQLTLLNTGATAGTATILSSGNLPLQGAATYTGLAWASPQALTLTFNVAATDQVTPVQWVVELIQ
jgi:hypothetical protein